MAQDIKYVAADWSGGWFHFVLRADNTFQVTAFGQLKDQQLKSTMNLSPDTYPPGFTQADQNSLLTLMGKLAREWSKLGLNAANVTRVGQIYYETGFEPPAP